MTEDMIDEHTTYLTSLNDADARTQAQLSSLLSDMQAFKVFFCNFKKKIFFLGCKSGIYFKRFCSMAFSSRLDM